MAIKTERRSKQREYILRYIYGTTTHPTAEDIYDNIKSEIPGISLGTVYRNLVHLSEDKKIAKIMNVKGIDHYDGNTNNHYHFLCLTCNSIYDLDMELLVSLEDNVNSKIEHQVMAHEINFRGICKYCLSKK